jgi:hypothetical protein
LHRSRVDLEDERKVPAGRVDVSAVVVRDERDGMRLADCLDHAGLEIDPGNGALALADDPERVGSCVERGSVAADRSAVDEHVRRGVELEQRIGPDQHDRFGVNRPEHHGRDRNRRRDSDNGSHRK